MNHKRHSTVVFIPHAAGRVYKIHLSPTLLKVVAAFAVLAFILSLVALLGSGNFVRQRALYRSLEKENRELRRTNQKLQEALAEVHSRLEQFEQRTKQLAIAAGVADALVAPAPPPRTSVGTGGPLDRLTGNPEQLLQREAQLERQLGAVEQRLSEQQLLLSHTPTIAPVVGVITDGFGPRIDPMTRQAAFHDGLDISAAFGTPVKAPADGLVVFADREAGYGKAIKINHGYGFVTVYGHLDRILVKEGQRVKRGDIIGRVGMTGRTTGPHLHYEVWKDGERQNPLHYILDAY
ncbi:MAG: peptidoglycan DD-metalloendopeptidase family protein [Thermoanaerobaculum sp.]|nr:peptidoglycan DD-metalloendopeptidase family protein [Thermoanaerobaculum sp.]